MKRFVGLFFSRPTQEPKMTSQKNKKIKKAKRPVQTPVSHKHEYLGMALITVLCLLVFGRNITYDVFSIDIPKMIFNNPHIMTGLSWDNIWWAFTEPNLALYQPLLNIMHMMEGSLFGKWPGGFHVVTLLSHIACMCLFLWVMTRLLQNFAVAFAATLVMCIHPVQILVVSQIATRGEILQAFFMLLSVDAYRRYVQKSSSGAYVFSIAFMFVGMLFKQTIIMLPFALLLLDYWPLKRIDISFSEFKKTTQTALHLTLEKIPWLVLSFVGGCFAIFGKMQYDQISHHLSKLTPFSAVYFVVSGYARYIGHLLYPLRPSYFEVYSETQTISFFLISIAVLILISTVALVFLWKRPYLIVGWLWFIVFMLPVSGILRYMMESIALRYLYMPAMGLYLAVFMGLYELATRKKAAVETSEEQAVDTGESTWYWPAVGVLTTIVALLAFWLNGFFVNTETTAEQILKVTHNRSALAHNALAVLRMQQQRFEEAEEHYKLCVEIQPESYLFYYYYAGALYKFEKYQKVVDVMAPAVEALPEASEYLELYSLGLMATGRYSEARKHLEKALEIEPNTISLLQNLAYCLILQGNYEDAQPYLEKGLRIEPDNPALLQLQEMSRSVVEIPTK
jgi:protein O-mannosyl-transferase